MAKLKFQKRPIQEWFAIASLVAIVITSLLAMIFGDFLINFVVGMLFTIGALVWWAIVAWLAKSKNTPVIVLSWIMGLLSLGYTILQILSLMGVLNTSES